MSETHNSSSTYIRVHKKRLEENYRHFQKSGLAIAPVVKANAYGHGAVETARILSSAFSIPFFVVASFLEAKELREAGLEEPILIIGYVSPEVAVANGYKDIIFTAVDHDHVKAFEAAAENPLSVHLKIDTGMHRYGSGLSQLDSVLNTLKEASHLRVTGTFSHFCDAADGVNDFSKRQLERFNKAVEEITNALASCKTIHIASTSSHPFRKMIDADTERVGIGLYGLADFNDEFTTRPALSLMSEIASVRDLPAGESVGYDRTYTADEKHTIATIPAGYFEGVDLRLSNKGVIRVGESLCPIIGRVSMNATVIDISNCDSQPSVGDPVEIISAERGVQNSAASIAETVGTINYNVTTQLPARVPRIVV